MKVVPGGTPSASPSWDKKPSDFNQRQNTVRDAQGDININALPNTIPGVSREELAEKLRKMETIQRQKTVDAHRESISKQIDTMRRAMPPKEFKEFLRTLEEREAKAMDEAELIGHMTPMQLYRYQLKKQRNENIKQWLNLVALVAVFLFGIYFLFYFLLFHFY